MSKKRRNCFIRKRIALSFVLLVFMFADTSEGAETQTAVGAIRWDAWSGCAVTAQVERTLGPEKYRDRLPWFAEVLDSTRVRINDDVQEIIDREIRYAADAGLDYWAFVLYPETNGMSRALRRYLDSELRSKLNFCVILHNNIGVSDREWTKERERVIALLKEPGYQKTAAGRPLVYYLSQRNERFQELREAVAQEGLNPYYVYLGWDPVADYRKQKPKGFDAVSAYADGPVVDTFAELVQHVENKWRQSVTTDIRYIPLVSTGWDKQPRKENPVSWELDHDYHKQAKFPSQAKPAEIAQHLARALRVVDLYPTVCEARAILIYAWNEYDEGGWLAPTWRKSGNPDTSRLTAIRAVLRRR